MPMTSNDLKKMRNPEELSRICSFSRLLAQCEIKHWIDFGTLLGAVREGGIIPDDFDFDIDFLAKDREHLLGIREEIYRQTGMIVIDGSVIRACPEHKRLVLGKGAIAAIGSCVSSGCLYIDLYPCDTIGRDVLHHLPYYDFKTFFIDALTTIQIDGSSFPCPRHAGQLLFHRYGPFWKQRITQGQYRRRHESEYVIPFHKLTSCYVEVHPEAESEDKDLVMTYATDFFDLICIGVSQPQSLNYRWTEARSSQVPAAFIAAPENLTSEFLAANNFDHVITTRQAFLNSRQRFEGLLKESRLSVLKIVLQSHTCLETEN